jgi:hypothetical protein
MHEKDKEHLAQLSKNLLGALGKLSDAESSIAEAQNSGFPKTKKEIEKLKTLKSSVLQVINTLQALNKTV